VRVALNGDVRELPAGATVADAAALVGVGAGDRGVAAAVDGEVVPRERWGETPVSPGARLEIVRAAAGG
jgi:sulfur carrier protein